MQLALARSRDAVVFFAREAGPTDCMLLAIGGVGWLAMGSMMCPAWLPLCVGSSSRLAHIHAELDAASQSGVLAAAALHWLLMIAAMMAPLLLEPVRHLSFRSARARRVRAVAAFLATYALTWMVVGLGVVVSMVLARSVAAPTAPAAPILAACSLAWQLSKARRTVLRQCHRMPALRSWGSAADRDCVVFGLRQATSCVLTCGPAMLTTMAVPIPLAGFVAGSLLLVERATLEASAKPLALLLAGLLLVSVLP